MLMVGSLVSVMRQCWTYVQSPDGPNYQWTIDADQAVPLTIDDKYSPINIGSENKFGRSRLSSDDAVSTTRASTWLLVDGCQCRHNVINFGLGEVGGNWCERVHFWWGWMKMRIRGVFAWECERRWKAFVKLLTGLTTSSPVPLYLLSSTRAEHWISAQRSDKVHAYC